MKSKLKKLLGASLIIYVLAVSLSVASHEPNIPDPYGQATPTNNQLISV